MHPKDHLMMLEAIICIAHEAHVMLTSNLWTEVGLVKLSEYKQQKSPIKLTECEILKSAYTGNLEVKLTSKTKIELSPKKFEIPSTSMEMNADPPVKILDIQKKSNFDKVCVKVKVLKVNSPSKVPSGKVKQDLIVADDSSLPCGKNKLAL